MKTDETYFVRIKTLADLAGIYPDRAWRVFYRGLISPDAHLKAGRAMQPLYLSSRIPELVAILKAYRDKISEQAA